MTRCNAQKNIDTPERRQELLSLTSKWRSACQQVARVLFNKIQANTASLPEGSGFGGGGTFADSFAPAADLRPPEETNLGERPDEGEATAQPKDAVGGPMTLGKLLDMFGISRELVHYNDAGDGFDDE